MHRKLRRLIEHEGWTQSALAKELDISQGYLSRFLKGGNSPRKALRDRIAALAARLPDVPDDDFVERVQRASRTSTEFKSLVEAALSLVENTNNKA